MPASRHDEAVDACVVGLEEEPRGKAQHVGGPDVDHAAVTHDGNARTGGPRHDRADPVHHVSYNFV